MTSCRGIDSAKGFTLVEVVVAITLSAIVVGFATMFLTAPVDAYYAQSRRSELLESSSAITRSISEDLRQALPNSVRISVSASRAIIELLLVEQVAFYRDPEFGGEPLRELSVGSTDAEFATLGSLHSPAAPLPAHYRLVVGNLGISGANAYQVPTNVITPAATSITIGNGGTPGEEDSVQLAPGFRFTTASPTKRIFLVSGPVTYICNSAAGARTVRRYHNYAITSGMPTSEAAAQLNAAGVVDALIATDVTACQVRCTAGSTTPCNGALVLDMTVSRAAAAGNETTKVFAELPVDNRP